ncbi:MAG: tetratricopeptide repeat protein [Prevotella sp.]|nr:tetratricopeptide repeat protein [Prevotella sp.]
MEKYGFWEMNTEFKKKLKKGAIDEARRLLYNMTQLYPQLNDNDLQGNKAIIHNALALDRVVVNFNLPYFVEYAMRLADSDWEGDRRNGRVIPSLGQRITNRLMSGIAERPEAYIKAVMPFFRKALQHNPSNKDNLRHLAQLYVRVKLKTQAIALYKQLLQRYHDSYLYAELAELVSEPQLKVALLCQAIVNQPKEAFNMGNRSRLAELLQMPEPTRAAYEIRKSMAARKKAGQPLPANVERIGRILAEYTPVTEAEQQLFYQRMAPVADAFIAH